jgi:GAF domain-containing protein
MDCFGSGQVIANVDLAESRSRWPTFTEAALQVGFTYSHALPLRLRRQVLGALNLFTVERTALSDEHLAVAQGMADIATIGLLHERALRDQLLLAEQLQTALHSRIVIEQAKGVLSARAGISVGDAFGRMRTHARQTGEPLTSVAEAVIAGRLVHDDLQPVRDRGDTAP